MMRDRRSTIGDRPLAIAENIEKTWETDFEAQRSLERKVLTEARVFTVISGGKQPN